MLSDWLHVDAAVHVARRVHPVGKGNGRVVMIPTSTVTGTLGDYTISNRRITETGFFGGYSSAAGDLFVPTEGTGWVLNRAYTVASNSTNFAALTTGQDGLPLANNTDTGGYIIPALSVLPFGTRQVAITSIVITAVDVGNSAIEIRAVDTGAILLSIPVLTSIASLLPLPIQLGGRMGISTGAGFTANCASAASTLAFDVHFRKLL